VLEFFVQPTASRLFIETGSRVAHKLDKVAEFAVVTIVIEDVF